MTTTMMLMMMVVVGSVHKDAFLWNANAAFVCVNCVGMLLCVSNVHMNGNPFVVNAIGKCV